MCLSLTPNGEYSAMRRQLHRQPELFSEEPNGDPSPAKKGTPAYETLPSVWFGTDAELLERMLDFYPRKRPRLILDATVNGARFWEGSKRRVIGLDVDARHRPDVVGDNRQMPFKDRCFDVVVYDPPHVPNQGKDQSKDFNTRFGLVLKSGAKTGYNSTPLYPPFAREALGAKRTDQPRPYRRPWIQR